MVLIYSNAVLIGVLGNLAGRPAFRGVLGFGYTCLGVSVSSALFY